MIAILSTAFAGLLMPPEQDVVIIRTGRDNISPRYNRVDYESACGSTVFRARFRNGPEERGLVEHVLIDGRPVPGAAEILDVRSARREIESIGIMHCGADPQRPEFRGSLEAVRGGVENRLDAVAAALPDHPASRRRLAADDGRLGAPASLSLRHSGEIGAWHQFSCPEIDGIILTGSWIHLFLAALRLGVRSSSKFRTGNDAGG
jgi:hypothetical protein